MTQSTQLCKNYLGKKQSVGILSVMEWPAQSPDLNPIELLWEQLDCMVRKKCPSSQSNLWEVLQEAWGDISSDYLNKLTARMPKVCKAVMYTEQKYKCNTFVFAPIFHEMIKDLKHFLYTQNKHLSQILFTNLSKSVIVSTSHWPR